MPPCRRTHDGRAKTQLPEGAERPVGWPAFEERVAVAESAAEAADTAGGEVVRAAERPNAQEEPEKGRGARPAAWRRR